jgi:hypothetical protein
MRVEFILRIANELTCNFCVGLPPRSGGSPTQKLFDLRCLGASEGDNRVELGGLLGGGNAKEQSNPAGNADG